MSADEFDREWLERLDTHLVLKLVGQHAFQRALASDALYDEPATMRENAAFAPLSEAGAGLGASASNVERRQSRVVLRLDEKDHLTGFCSRCYSTYQLCPHMLVLAVDLACSRGFRQALQNGENTRSFCENAITLRQSMLLEASFDKTLRAWLAPAGHSRRVEIAAAPVVGKLGRDYGDEFREQAGLSLVVRRAGERRLIEPRQLTPLSEYDARDRTILRYARGGTNTRKAAEVTGVEAALVLEAMREHGRVFSQGFKALLDFRSAQLRPRIDHQPAASDSDVRYEMLRAFWTADGLEPIALTETFFFAGPVSFVWTKAGAIYRVARDVDIDMVEELMRAPVLAIPPGRLEEAGARLLRAARGRGIQTPASETFGLPPIEVPRVVLRLAGDPLDVVGELVAIYKAGEIPLLGPNAVGDGEPPRDGAIEAEARALVERVGLVVVESDDDDVQAPSPSVFDKRVAAYGEGAITLWQRGMVDLRASQHPRIEVELTEKLARVRVGEVIVPRVFVTLEGNWLDTKLDFSSKDLSVELSEIRAALARKERWVSLSDGTLARITHALEALVDEAGEVMGEESHAKLPAHQLGRLERWMEENDGRMDAAVEGLRKRLRSLAVSAEPDMPEGLVATLRPYQRLGLAWLQFLKVLGAGGILADDMGLGKTITALAFLQRWKEDEGSAPSLVVCPTSVATNWVHEARRFTPSLRVHLHHGARGMRSRTELEAHDVVVTTYALLREDLDRLASVRFRAVILDEAQWVKNADSATRRAAGKLDAGIRLALSGTPIENRLSELWSIASFVNPGMLGTARTFEHRYERGISTNLVSELVDELRAVMRPFMLRRTKDEVLRELPPKTEIDRFVLLTSENKRLYDALALTLREGLAKAIEKEPRNGPSTAVFAAITRLRQMACEPRLVDPRLPAYASAKREAFLELVRELVAEKRRALVFSQFVELLTLWRKDLDDEGIAYEYLDGSTRHRDVVVAQFQEGKAPLFLISLKAGGAGLNLTAADTVIHCDPWWNPAVEDQATDRAHRIGQDKPVTVVRLVASGTIEEKIRSLKAKKRQLTKAVIADGAGALAGINDDDLKLLLGDADPSELQGDDERALTEVFATASEIVSPEFERVVVQARRWLDTTGGPEAELATLVDIPVAFANKLARGEPFPCSRAVANRISEKLEAFRRGFH